MTSITALPRTALAVAAVSLALLGSALAPARSTAATDAGAAAVAWAADQHGSTAWDGLCLQFVGDAYDAAGLDLSALRGDGSTAISYWNTYTGVKHPPSSDPPTGALVFWDDGNAYGHVAISTGQGKALSSRERGITGVHYMTISAREGQVGWVIPG
jgi:cell wall-associated NlpC family hydrolase